MKKLLAVILAASLSVYVFGCSSNSTNSSEDESSDNSTVQVDEGLLTVDITMPASYFEDKTEDEIKAAATENGYLNCVVNADGSVTYTMTKAKRSEMLQQMKESIDSSINDLVNGENAIESFQKIEYNDDISLVNIYVDSSSYKAFDALSGLAFYISGAYYQVFSGVNPDDVDVVINFIDESTGDVLNTMSYRDYMNNVNSTSAS